MEAVRWLDYFALETQWSRERLNGSSEVVRLFCIGDIVEQRAEIEWKQ